MGVDLITRLENAKRCTEVFGLATRVLVLTGEPFAFSEVAMVERQRHETTRGHRDRVVPRGLLFDARHRPGENETCRSVRA